MSNPNPQHDPFEPVIYPEDEHSEEYYEQQAVDQHIEQQQLDGR